MVASPRFRADYVKVVFQTPPPRPHRGTLWVRREGKAGVRRGPSRIAVPGHLFAANPQTIVHADPSGALESRATAAEPARLDRLAVPAGRWRLSVRTTGAASAVVRVARAADGGGAVLAEGAPPLSFHLDAPSELALEVRAGGPSQELGLLELVLAP